MQPSSQLHATQKGTGPLLVVVHGFLSSGQYFKPIIDHLALSHHVVAVDLRGHGRSKGDADDDYSLEAQARAIHDRLEHMGLLDRPISFVGHSMGSLICIEYAQLFASAVEKLILINPPMFAGLDQAQASITSTGRFYRAMLFSRYRRVLWALLKLTPRFTHKNRRSINSIDLLSVPHYVRDASLYDVILPSNFFTQIEQLDIPSLVVVGRRDREVYQENLANWQIPPHVTLSVNNYGHHFIADQPKKAFELIEEFLNPSNLDT